MVTFHYVWGRLRCSIGPNATGDKIDEGGEVYFRFADNHQEILVFLTRARQVDNIPDDRRGWVSQVLGKNPNRPDLLYLEYLNDGETYEEYEFTIPSMANYYDTNEPAEFDYNMDTETMQKYMVASTNEGASQIEAISEYLHISKNIAKKETKKVMKKLKKMASLARGENPKSLDALKKINEQRRLEKEKKDTENERKNSKK